MKLKTRVRLFFVGAVGCFFSFCIQGKRYSHVDFQGVPLDSLLINIFEHKKEGIFVEVGANDGLMQSNTKLLEEEYNWAGVLIEPSPNIFVQLCNNRPFSRCFQCALGSFDEDGKYAYGDFDGHPMSSLTGRFDRPANQKVLIRSLQSILDECSISHINFFSLDTEGYEFNILNGIDFEKVTLDYMLIEIYNNEFELIVSFLQSKGYRLVKCLTNYNYKDNLNWDGTHNDYLFTRI